MAQRKRRATYLPVPPIEHRIVGTINAARRLSKSERTIYRLLSEGLIHRWVVGHGGESVFDARELDSLGSAE